MLTLRKGRKTDKFQTFLIDLSDYVITFSRPIEEGDEKANLLLQRLNENNVKSYKDIPFWLRNKMHEKGVDFYPNYKKD